MKPYYEDYNSTLYIGDCADVLPQLDVKPQLILTSPPYDNLRNYGGTEFDFDRVADAIVNIMPEGGMLVWIVNDATIEGSETLTSFHQAIGFRNRGLKVHDTMILEKVAVPILQSNRIRYKGMFEYMFVFVKGKIRVANIIADVPLKHAGHTRNYVLRRQVDGELRKSTFPNPLPSHGRRSNIWRYNVSGHHAAPDSKATYRHPAVFPIALAQDHIRSWTNPGDLVLDPMAGSGTTLKAARNLSRQGVGVEVHKPYCNLIVPRLAEQTFDVFGDE